MENGTASEKRETIKVIVDLNLCQSHGECVFVAPNVFELGDDDVLRWEGEVAESQRAEVEEAVSVCPLTAIKLEG
ncbi:MAG: ferredoxin [Solirubrobacterales bacterium]|nr:ferredoxin [Solirubrobacterales bacterium]